MKFLSLLNLFSAYHLNLGYCIMGPPILCTAFCILLMFSVHITAMACITALAVQPLLGLLPGL